ncbi:adenylosuccinate synthase [Sesbania bispinosa]|nr:adenylosuccinate synthase [Sesbania bispinosa]
MDNEACLALYATQQYSSNNSQQSQSYYRDHMLLDQHMITPFDDHQNYDFVNSSNRSVVGGFNGSGVNTISNNSVVGGFNGTSNVSRD